MKGLEEELHSEGIQTLGGTDPSDNTLAPFSLATWERDPDVGAVVCGLDLSINYTKLSKAYQYLLHDPSVHFIVTNEDSTFPSQHGLLPGGGSISAPLRFALGREPVVTGKPSQTMLDCIKAKVKFEEGRTIMVGDRLNTDILFGKQGGLKTLLVMTGEWRSRGLWKPMGAGTDIPRFDRYYAGARNIRPKPFTNRPRLYHHLPRRPASRRERPRIRVALDTQGSQSRPRR